MITLILSVILVSTVALVAFCSTAFSSHDNGRGRRSRNRVDAAFGDIRDEKVDPLNPSSRTYRELVDEERSRLETQ